MQGRFRESSGKLHDLLEKIRLADACVTVRGLRSVRAQGTGYRVTGLPGTGLHGAGYRVTGRRATGYRVTGYRATCAAREEDRLASKHRLENALLLVRQHPGSGRKCHLHGIREIREIREMRVCCSSVSRAPGERVTCTGYRVQGTGARESPVRPTGGMR